MPTVVAANLGGRVTYIVFVAVHVFRYLGLVCL